MVVDRINYINNLQYNLSGERLRPDHQDKTYNFEKDITGRRIPSLNYASTGSRIIAYIIDSIIIGFIIGAMLLGVFLIGISYTEAPSASTEFFPFGFFDFLFPGVAFGSYLLQLLYFTYFESKDGGGGATFGKRVMDIKVVDRDGRKISGSDSFKRNIARLLWSLPCVGFIIMIVDVVLIHDGDQRIGDKIANTYVVEKSEFSDFSNDYQKNYPAPRYDRRAERTQSYDTSRPSYRDEMQKCPQCGKKSLMVNSDGSAYCTRCDYMSMKRNVILDSEDFSR